MGARRNIIIIGGSAAGVAAAQAIVEHDQGRSARVTIVSAEDRQPYKRTKVSKTFAEGFDRDAFALNDWGWYTEHGVVLMVDQTISRVDTDLREVHFDDGGRLPWDRLVLATGAAPRRPPLPDNVADLIHHANSAAEVEALRELARRSSSALVVGMGVLGSEVAEQLARMGLAVTLAGDTPGVMTGELNGTASAMLADALRSGGVDLLFNETVGEIQRAEGGLRVSFTGSPREATYDLAVFCIGTQIRNELARDAGLQVNEGVVVDRQLRTSHPDILAAGDVAQHPGGRVTHLWRHALDQGRVAGLNALGRDEPYRFVPFRLKCKIFESYFFSVGQLEVGEVVERRDGERYLCCYYGPEARLAGVVMCNDEPNQKLYNTAVVEGWDRRKVEGIG